jgi:hypothetical protein
MPSDAVPATLPVIHVQGSQAPIPAAPYTSGKSLPPGGNHPAPPADIRTSTSHVALPTLIAQLNKYLNDSGRPNQFRIDPASRGRTIQEINPANGDVVGQFSVSQFPELARSLGVSGALFDGLA